MFPSQLDDLSTSRPPTGASKLNGPDHLAHHVREDDIIQAIENKIGVDNSLVPTSLDYLLKHPNSVNPGHKHNFLSSPDGSNPDSVYVDNAGNVGFGKSNPTYKVDINGNLRAEALVANQFPKFIGALEANNTVIKTSVPAGWSLVPYDSVMTHLVISFTVPNSSALYLVSFVFRYQTSTTSIKFSGINVVGPTNKLIQCQGINTALSDYGTSGVVYVTGLIPGTYTFQLYSYDGVAQNRTFSQNRQLLIYRLI